MSAQAVALVNDCYVMVTNPRVIDARNVGWDVVVAMPTQDKVIRTQHFTRPGECAENVLERLEQIGRLVL